MNKTGRNLLIFGLAITIVKFSDLQAKFQEFMAPALSEESLTSSSLSIEHQRDKLIEFEYKICEAFSECSSATRTQNPNLAAEKCTQAANALDRLYVPSGMPEAVSHNMELYRDSNRNTTRRLASLFDNAAKSGGSFQAYVGNPEIDTCGYNSIPQKMFRLYKLDQLTKTKLVTCKEIMDLYQSRVPASK